MSSSKLLSFGFLFLITSCGSQFNSKEDCKDELDSIANLPQHVNARKWNKTNIVVCWDDAIGFDQTEKDKLQSLVKEGWEQYINLNFIGWGLCSLMVNPDIVIQNGGFTDKYTIGVTDFIGMPPRNRFPDHITINFDLCTGPMCRQRVIIHEFGHVINLRHEQSRIDTPQWCKDDLENNFKGDEKQSIEDPNQTLVGPWDNDSIMNYCNPYPTVPSCWDIANAVLFYGAKSD